MNKIIFLNPYSRFNYFLNASFTALAWAFGLLLLALIGPPMVAVFVLPFLPIAVVFGVIGLGLTAIAVKLWPQQINPEGDGLYNLVAFVLAGAGEHSKMTHLVVGGSMVLGLGASIYAWDSGWFNFWVPIADASFRFLDWWVAGLQPYAEAAARYASQAAHQLADGLKVLFAYLGLD